MSNRFGIEDIAECESCRVETLGEAYCAVCAEARYAALEAEAEDREEACYLASFPERA